MCSYTETLQPFDRAQQLTIRHCGKISRLDTLEFMRQTYWKPNFVDLANIEVILCWYLLWSGGHNPETLWMDRITEELIRRGDWNFEQCAPRWMPKAYDSERARDEAETEDRMIVLYWVRHRDAALTFIGHSRTISLIACLELQFILEQRNLWNQSRFLPDWSDQYFEVSYQ